MDHRKKERISVKIVQSRALCLLCMILVLLVFSACSRKAQNTSGQSGQSGQSSSSESQGSAEQAGPDSGELQAVFFDVGKGDCILLTMGESHVLLDTGYEETAPMIIGKLKEQGVESLDAMIITHYDKDHVGGAAEIAQAIPVDRFYLPDYDGEADKCGDLIDLIQKKGLDSIRVSAKEQIALGQAEIEVDPALVEYDPIEENDNDASLIIKIYYQDDEWLLPGDIEKEAIEVWLSENTQTFDIVKMPHHGRKEGNTKEFIENTDPSIAVITDSTEDEANKKVLKQLDKKNIPYYRSSVDGTITITGNGSGIYEVTKEE